MPMSATKRFSKAHFNSPKMQQFADVGSIEIPSDTSGQKSGHLFSPGFLRAKSRVLGAEAESAQAPQAAVFESCFAPSSGSVERSPQEKFLAWVPCSRFLALSMLLHQFRIQMIIKDCQSGDGSSVDGKRWPEQNGYKYPIAQ